MTFRNVLGPVACFDETIVNIKQNRKGLGNESPKRTTSGLINPSQGEGHLGVKGSVTCDIHWIYI
jgi:hypothetical protein